MKSSFWRRFRRNKGAVFGLVVLALVALVTALGPLVAQHEPWDMAGMPFAAPLAEPGMPLGTDTMGRDILSGIVAGARVSLLIGVVSTVVSLFIGVGVGAVAGYFGGWIDATLMRFTELFQAIPSFALAIVLVAIFEPSVQSIVAAIAVVSWPPVARVVRAEFLSLRSREFVQAAEVLGRSRVSIVFGDIYRAFDPSAFQLSGLSRARYVVFNWRAINAFTISRALSVCGPGFATHSCSHPSKMCSWMSPPAAL